MERCLVSTRVGFFVFMVNMIEVFFAICTLTWRVSNYVSVQGRGINRRKESTVLLLVVFYY